MHRLLLIVYFAGLFLFAGWIFVLEMDADHPPSEDAAMEEDAQALSDTPAEEEELQTSSDEHAAQTSSLKDRAAAHEDRHDSAVRPPPSDSVAAGSTFEQPYLELGYKTVYDAVRDCEMRYMQRINLPIYTPAVEFTHQLARCDVHFTDDDFLEINYLHENRRDRRFMILIRPAKHKVDVPASRVKRMYKLEDDTDARLSLTPEGGYHVLDFERGGWQYLFIVPKSLEDEMPPEELVKAANSVRTAYPAVVNRRY